MKTIRMKMNLKQMKEIYDFEDHVIKKSFDHPVIVEFSAPGCGPCWWMEKTLIETVKERDENIEFVSLPTHMIDDAIIQYKLKSNPTTLLFLNGKEVARLSGALPKMVLHQWLDDHLSANVS